MRLSQQSDEYLIDLYVRLGRAHTLGAEILRGSRPWIALRDRIHYLEFVGNEILGADCVRGSKMWNDILEKNAEQVKNARHLSDIYATQDDEEILFDYFGGNYDFHIWLNLVSKIEPVRLKKIKEKAALLNEEELLRERQEAFLDMYSDF